MLDLASKDVQVLAQTQGPSYGPNTPPGSHKQCLVQLRSENYGNIVIVDPWATSRLFAAVVVCFSLSYFGPSQGGALV